MNILEVNSDRLARELEECLLPVVVLCVDYSRESRQLLGEAEAVHDSPLGSAFMFFRINGVENPTMTLGVVSLPHVRISLRRESGANFAWSEAWEAKSGFDLEAALRGWLERNPRQ